MEKKLIACANIFPINSLYFWEDKIKDEGEFVLLCKTIQENFEKVKEEVEKIHSYEVPCVIKIPIEANEKYSNWLKEQID